MTFRVRPASVFIALLLVAASVDIATGLEHWPFGSYPMYSLLSQDRFDSLRLYGVTATGEELLRSDADFAPFDQARLVGALSRLRPTERALALEGLLQLHNRNAAVPLRGLRLYGVSWRLTQGVPAEEQGTRNLLAESSAVDR